MKSNLLAIAFLAAATLAPFAARADDDEVSFETFYENLSPFGEWIEVGDYGNCWHPTGVDEEWAPYTDGYWSYTDAGWTWVSYEDFGDICYHYGRWVTVDDVGWCWVPDQEWGPAWVSWRQDDDYIGWAPLPPEAHWRQNVGLSVWVDDYYDIGPSYYNFCPIVEFSAPVIRHVCVPRVTVISIFGRSRNITNISWNGYHNHVFCGGPNFTVINTRLRRPIPTFKLVQNTTIINNNITVINNRRVVKFPRSNVAGNTLNVFAPKVVKKNVTNFKPQVTKVVQKDKVNRGWKLQNQGEVTKLREKVKTEAKGMTPESAPAKPMQVADLKPVPEKADPKGPSPVADRGERHGNARDGNNNPERGVADRPGRDAVEDDKAGGPQSENGKPKKVAGDKSDRNNENKPGRGAGNPLVRPFNEPDGDREPGQGAGARKGQASQNDGATQAEVAERAERQQRAAEARQRQMEAQREKGNGAERSQRPPQVQRDQPDPQALRQQQMQRQAQEQQRQLQLQRQQQMQRQLQQQQIQRQQGAGGGQGKQEPQQQGQGGKGGQRQLTPQEREALRNQRGF